MIHPDTELRWISPEIGVGVFAIAPIAHGTVVWVLDDLDQILDPADVEALDALRRARVDKYAYRNQHGQYVVCWDDGRFVNHSFSPTSVGTAYELELATRDLEPGDEITCDYGTLNERVPFEPLPEPGSERTLALPDDLLTYAPEWDHIALAAFARFDDVAQPLAHLIEPRFVPRIRAAVEQGVLLDSIASIHYRPEP